MQVRLNGPTWSGSGWKGSVDCIRGELVEPFGECRRQWRINLIGELVLQEVEMIFLGVTSKTTECAEPRRRECGKLLLLVGSGDESYGPRD